MPSHNSLSDLLVDQLKDLYSAELQLIDALPQMADAATSEDLKQGFLVHLEETKGHAKRLEEAFSLLKIHDQKKTCKAMHGLVEEGSEAIGFEGPGAVRDVALIGAARRVEHYEVAAYKSTRALAGTVGEELIADLLQQTLDEECDADKKLCTLSGPICDAAREGPSAEVPKTKGPLPAAALPERKKKK